DRTLDRDVALKFVHTSVDPARADRWLLEARALARINHPHVVTIHEAGIVRGHAFLAMELVDGPHLEAWIHTERPSLDALRVAFEQAAQGLRAVAQAGLVHRDVKPSNLLLDRLGTLKVADFGLVHAALGAREDDDGGRAGRPASRPSIMGTPAYMAPEQWRGLVPDARTDMFALGVCLYEAVWGERPTGP